ncbi:HlyD family efflux transporter periplasmic adaptor subunit [Halotia wernerae UHCC 0503]|nr:HlyD family efflux transporter periplasmic adaptor subunit [Halotia wernerae UHCC 0503]
MVKSPNALDNQSQQTPSNFVKYPEDQSTQPQTSFQKPKRKISKLVLLLAITGILAGVGYGIYRFFPRQSEPEGLFLSGRIEGYETHISAKSGGKIAILNVREGDFVKPGQLLAQIDDSQIHAEMQGAIAKVQAARQRLKRQKLQLPVMQAQLQQANLATEQVAQEAQGKVFEAQKSIASAHAQLVEAQSSLHLAQVKQKRTSKLYAEGAVSAQQLDEDTAGLKVRQARVDFAKQELLAAQGTLTQAQATLRNRPIRAAAALQIEKQIVQAHTDIEEAEQEIHDAQANQSQIQAKLNDLVIQSPLGGTVITRSVEVGEVVANSAPLLSIVNLNHLYLRGFVPVEEIGKVKINQSSLVYLDSSPTQPLEAIVTRIDSKASFTPENIYFQKDRVTQVFGVELTLKNPQGLAKPGIPADARILIPQEQQKPAAKNPSILGFFRL